MTQKDSHEGSKRKRDESTSHSHSHSHQEKEEQGRRKSRIIRLGTMLVAIVVFCVVELVIGHLAHSLALVADSFHMMSDALSLIIAAVAINVGGKINKEKNTFGWLRAEILGAVINGVFLLALCLTITLHAVERLFKPEAVESPMMVLLVGGIGLLVNVFGMFLFHEHGHSHGHAHSHDEGNTSKKAAKTEGEKKVRNGAAASSSIPLNRSFTIASPDLNYGRFDHGGLKARSGSISEMSSIRRKINFVVHEELCNSAGAVDVFPLSDGEESSDDGLVEVFIQEKRAIIDEYIEEECESGSSSPSIGKEPATGEIVKEKPLLKKQKSVGDVPTNKPTCVSATENTRFLSNEDENKPKRSHSQHQHHHHGSSNNMRAVFLHILSDLFASVLVIFTASAYILMEKFGQDYGGKDAKWLLYIDPALSIVIVVIIVVPTYKLIRESAEILLNNAPDKISPQQFAKELSRQIPEVTSVHDLYLWHLTADIIVATIHVVVKRTWKDGQASPREEDFEERFMTLSSKLNSFFHDWGVHTTTIQVEFANPKGITNDCSLRCNCEKAVSGVSNSTGRKISTSRH